MDQFAEERTVAVIDTTFPVPLPLSGCTMAQYPAQSRMIIRRFMNFVERVHFAPAEIETVCDSMRRYVSFVEAKVNDLVRA